MEKELLELVKEKLLKIKDIDKQVDVLHCFLTISNMSTKLSEAGIINSAIEEDLTIADCISYSDEQLDKKYGEKSYIIKIWRAIVMDSLKKGNYEEGYMMHRKKLCDLITSSRNPNETFAQSAIDLMFKYDQLFDAGIALFHDDEQVQELAKQYRIKSSKY